MRPEGVEVPSPGLESETIVTYETGLKWLTDSLTGSVFYHYSSLNNMLERSSGTYQGLPFYDGNGNGLHDEGEFDIIQKRNIGEAKIHGVEMDASYRFNSTVMAFGNYTWTKGKDAIRDIPYSWIPPDFGTLGIRFSTSATLKPWVELVYHFADSQKDLSPRDIKDSRIGPNGTDGFNVFHLRSGISVSRNSRVTVALENIFDEKYKYHASGVYRPGRQLVFGAEFRF
jgi:outer membrane receptor protein involved in Fe transport